AYYKASDEDKITRTQVVGTWANPDDHEHSNYVPLNGIETCPQAQRATTDAELEGNSVTPQAGDPVNQFLVAPKNPDDNHTPSITQGALVFGTDTIAGDAMKQVGAAVAKCPASYEVRGGPSPLLGTYSVSSRELEVNGWKGVVQQIAHTN